MNDDRLAALRARPGRSLCCKGATPMSMWVTPRRCCARTRVV